MADYIINCNYISDNIICGQIDCDCFEKSRKERKILNQKRKCDYWYNDKRDKCGLSPSFIFFQERFNGITNQKFIKKFFSCNKHFTYFTSINQHILIKIELIKFIDKLRLRNETDYWKELRKNEIEN